MASHIVQPNCSNIHTNVHDSIHNSVNKPWMVTTKPLHCDSAHMYINYSEDGASSLNSRTKSMPDNLADNDSTHIYINLANASLDNVLSKSIPFFSDSASSGSGYIHPDPPSSDQNCASEAESMVSMLQDNRGVNPSSDYLDLVRCPRPACMGQEALPEVSPVRCDLPDCANLICTKPPIPQQCLVTRTSDVTSLSPLVKSAVQHHGHISKSFHNKVDSWLQSLYSPASYSLSNCQSIAGSIYSLETFPNTVEISSLHFNGDADCHLALCTTQDSSGCSRMPTDSILGHDSSIFNERYPAKPNQEVTLDSDATFFLQQPLMRTGVTDGKITGSRRRSIARKLKRIGRYLHMGRPNRTHFQTLAVL